MEQVRHGRNETDLKDAIIEIQALREEFYKKVRVPGTANDLNPELDKASVLPTF